MSKAMVRALRREMQKSVQSGFLVSWGEILRTLQGPAKQAPQLEIASVGFPTCDRVEALQRSITSHLENARWAGRTNDFVVMDDSGSPETRDAYRQMLRELKTRYDANIVYAGLEQKVEFAKKLIEAGDLPADVVYFAFLGDKQYGATTVGANRNALLLHTVGDLTFCADDDTVCQTAAPPEQEEGIAFSSEQVPLEVWFYPDRESALRSVRYVEHDVLALHEQWLGEEPLLGLAARAHDREVSCERAEPRMLRLLGTRPSRIMVTSNGTAGDCAWDDPYYYLFQKGDTLKRLSDSAREYRHARDSREVVQAVRQTTILETANPVSAMSVGLDNRSLLPPFTPVGRAEEVAFSAIVSKCFGDVYAAHLPWVVPHVPVQRRSFSAQHVLPVGPKTLIPSCIDSFNPMSPRSPAEQLRKLGQHLEEVGRLPTAVFEEYLRATVWRSISSSISELEERLRHVDKRTKRLWSQDVRAFVELARKDALAPVEQLYELEGGQEAIQLLLTRFGQVLMWWPAMVQTASQLRDNGRRLAQPV
jgi:hypothetical protein